jgi:hypothetical protein
MASGEGLVSFEVSFDVTIIPREIPRRPLFGYCMYEGQVLTQC